MKELCTRCNQRERYYPYYCKECKRDIDATSYQKHREQRLLDRKRDREKLRDFLIELRKNPCTDCHQKFPYWIMEWDHLPQFEKSFDICTASSERLALEEIKKCELVCANCHRTRTHNRRSGVDGDTLAS